MKSYYLIPWSVGFECRTTKPEGHSIEVVKKSEYDALDKELQEAKHEIFNLEKYVQELHREFKCLTLHKD